MASAARRNCQTTVAEKSCGISLTAGDRRVPPAQARREALDHNYRGDGKQDTEQHHQEVQVRTRVGAVAYLAVSARLRPGMEDMSPIDERPTVPDKTPVGR